MLRGDQWMMNVIYPIFHPLPGPEYGTTEAAWKSILTESERVSDLHQNMKEQLCNEVLQEIRVWQKDNYHKVS